MIDFEAIKSRVPLAKYCRENRIELKRRGANLVGLCPLHDEKSGSFTIYPDNHFSCYGCGANGDVTDLEQQLRGGSKADAAQRLAQAHGFPLPVIRNSSSNVNGHQANQGPNGSHFDWQPKVDAVTDANLTELSQWRGFSPEYCRGLRDRNLIGRYGDKWAFPVRQGGEVVAMHYRVVKADGEVKWIYQPSKIGKSEPFVIGPLSLAQTVHCFESQWDQFALADKLGPLTVTISTRGALHTEKLKCVPESVGQIILWPQSDEPGEKWLVKAIDVLGNRQIKIARIPQVFKDLNEWTKAGATPQEVQAAIDAASAPEPAPAAEPERKARSSTESFCEEALAIQLGDQIGELRTIGSECFVLKNGVWKPRDQDEFKPLALAVLPEAYRTQRRARDVQLHLEMRSQVQRSDFCGAMRFGAGGEVMIAIQGGTLIIPVRESEAVRLVETDRNLGFTIALPIHYNLNAVPETFSRVLHEAVPDPQERELFLDVLATALIPDCRYERALVAIGETGSGKSTVCSPLPFIFGEACSFLSLADLCHPQGYKLSLLSHKALNIGTELNTLEFDDSGLFKQLVSGERLTVRPIYGRPFEMTSHASLVFLANSLPRFKHGTQAEVRRIGFVRFDHRPDRPDVTLKSRVAADAEGLFVELVRRAQELLASRPITESGRLGRETAERFALTNDPVGKFVAQHCNLGLGLQCEKAHLWNEFTEFCERASLSERLDERWFFRTLYDRFPGVQQRQVRTGDGRTRVITGVDIRD